jgi:hypothetical protein
VIFMSMQMTIIEVDHNTAAILRALQEKAEAQGTTLDTLLKPLTEGENGTAASPEPPPRNEAMLAVIRRTHERLKDLPVSGSTEETLKLIREARAGAMWGYEPTDIE